MELSSRLYSHHKHLLRQRRKPQPQKKINIETPPIKRSVTYNSDADLLKQITENENLVELIGNIQKQRSPQTIHHTENTERTILPPIKQNYYGQQYSSQRKKKIYTEQSYEPTIQTINRRQLNFSIDLPNNNEKSIKQIETKRKDYDSIKTADTAVSSQQNTKNENRLLRSLTERVQDLQNSEFQQKFKPLKLIQEKEQLKVESQQVKLYELSKQDYDNLESLYSKQYKMDTIIRNALKMKSQKKDPANASKSIISERIQLQLELKKQYEQSLELALEGYQVCSQFEDKKLKQDQFNQLIRRLTKKKKEKTQQEQQESLIVKSQKKRLFVNKTIDIQGQCTDILDY